MYGSCGGSICMNQAGWCSINILALYSGGAWMGHQLSGLRFFMFSLIASRKMLG
jgi:hypothetical protein